MALTLPRGGLADALYWDMADPYHYIRLQPGPGVGILRGGPEAAQGPAHARRVRLLIPRRNKQFRPAFGC